MISTNSSNNILKMIKLNFRRYGVMFGLFQAAAVVVGSIIVNSIAALYSPEELTAAYDITNAFQDTINFFAILCCFEAFLFATVLFSEIYSKRACDFYCARPVKRGTWFNGHYLFGALGMAVSYLIFDVAALLVFKVHIIKKYQLLTVSAGDLFKYTAVSFLAVLVLYTVFVMCACVSGRMWQHIFLSFICTGVLCLGAVGAICYLNTIYGLWFNISENYFVSAVGLVFSTYTKNVIVKITIAAVIQLVIFYVAGYLAFKRRKAEVAENSLAGRVLPILLTALCFLSEVFVCLGISDELSLAVKITAAVILVAITAIVLSALFFRKVISKQILISLAGTVAVSAVFIFCVQVIPEKNYVNYIPNSSEVESVTVSNYGTNGSTSMTDLLYGRNYFVMDGSTENRYTFKTDAGKNSVSELHKNMLSETTQNNIYSMEFYRTGYSIISFDYILKNGKTLNRTYAVSIMDIRDKYADMLKTEEGFSQTDIGDVDANAVVYISLETYDFENDEYETPIVLENVDNAKLLDCIVKDYLNADTARFINYADSSMNVWTIEEIEEVTEQTLWLNFNCFAYGVSDYYKELLLALSPEDMLKYEKNHISQGTNNSGFFSETSIGFTIKDKNTISYLESLGYTLK